MELTVENPTVTQIHVTQNVPRNSKMMVNINGAQNCEIHASQVGKYSERNYTFKCRGLIIRLLIV
jgi:hypothetical protein